MPAPEEPLIELFALNPDVFGEECRDAVESAVEDDSYARHTLSFYQDVYEELRRLGPDGTDRLQAFVDEIAPPSTDEDDLA